MSSKSCRWASWNFCVTFNYGSLDDSSQFLHNHRKLHFFDLFKRVSSEKLLNVCKKCSRLLQLSRHTFTRHSRCDHIETHSSKCLKCYCTLHSEMNIFQANELLNSLPKCTSGKCLLRVTMVALAVNEWTERIKRRSLIDLMTVWYHHQ